MEKPIITKSWAYNHWCWAVWYRGIRRGLYETREEAEITKKKYENRVSFNIEVGKQ